MDNNDPKPEMVRLMTERLVRKFDLELWEHIRRLPLESRTVRRPPIPYRPTSGYVYLTVKRSA